MTIQTTASDDEQFVVVDEDAASPAEEEGSPNKRDASISTPTETPLPPEIFLKGLSVLSPRQKNKNDDVVVVVPLPPLRPEEPVMSIRHAMSEVIGFAHLTKYRLVIERTASTSATSSNNDGDLVNRNEVVNSSKGGCNNMRGGRNSNNCTNRKGSASDHHKNLQQDIVSTHTLDNAVVTSDRLAKSLQLGHATDDGNANDSKEVLELELDDFGDLSILLDELKKVDKLSDKDLAAIAVDKNKIFIDASDFALRVVLEQYDLASIRDQIGRVRLLLEGNAPHLTSLAAEMVVDSEEEERAVKQDQIFVKNDRSHKGNVDGNVDGKTAIEKENGKNGEAIKKETGLEADLPNFPPGYDLSFSEHIKGGDLSTFYYLACGEEQRLLSLKGFDAVDRQNGKGGNNKGKENKKSKANKKKSQGNKNNTKAVEALDLNCAGLQKKDNSSFSEVERALYELNEATYVQCALRHSGYHPPPVHRRHLGDLAYIECTLPGGSSVHVTAFHRGFYINRSTSSTFNPSPAKDPCYSHTLLDCLLQHSETLREAWITALTASKNRADLIRETVMTEDPITFLLRSAVSAFPNNNSGTGIGGHMTPAPSTFTPRIDSVVQTPSWLVPLPSSIEGSWQHDKMHQWNTNRTEEDLLSTHGVEVRLGGMRDWNEEIQSAREMPSNTLPERLERAKLVHKIMSEFGDAAIQGVKAIFNGLVTPMNINESSRSYVYLHNNIFFSRAIDIGMDTFKIFKGDNAARKSASRDLASINLLHRLDIPGIHTLGTVIVEYMGMRIVCQSIIPGILHGEKSHTIAYGTVDARLQLRRDDEIHNLVEDIFGEVCMVATRTVPASPLTDERMEAMKKLPVLLPKEKECEDEEDRKKTITFCGPIEMKAIIGSDKRKYLMDCTRLTPRDANWIDIEKGGTGMWDNGRQKYKHIPKLDGDDWVTCVLRPEIVSSYSEMKASNYLSVIIKEDEDTRKNENTSTGDDPLLSSKSAEKLAETRAKLEMAEKDYIKTLKYNVNVFLPDIRSVEDLDKDAHQQLLKDEEEVRSISCYLWETVMPKLTIAIRLRSDNGLSIPVDGASLTEFIHQYGINCRYLGRLAELAMEEEAKDIAVEKAGQNLIRQRMPLCWLDLLECEMVARAAKHVLNSYIIQKGEGVPCAKLIAAFLSAVVSTDEESASETEQRMNKSYHLQGTLSEEDTNALVMMFDGDTDDQRGRSDIWSDIECEVGCRFRYTLSFYGNGKSKELKARALYLPLLRRICQRSGIRIAGRRYDLGGKCLMGGSGRLAASYPVAPIDILDILPLVKHSASVAGKSFVPCSFDGSSGSQSLHVLLNDVQMIYDAAFDRLSQGTDLSLALEFLNETMALCQRVVETTNHLQIQKCLKLIATGYANSNNLELALVAAEKYLAMAVSLAGFDSVDAYNAHLAISDIFFAKGKVAEGIKHYRAVQFLGEAMAGPNYSLASIDFNIGRRYFEAGRNEDALRFYEVAAKKRNQDSVVDGVIARHSAMTLARLERFKEAFDYEKTTYKLYSAIYGDDHDRTRESEALMNHFMTLAIKQGKLQQKKDKDTANSSAADAIAKQLLAAEDASAAKKRKHNKRRVK